ncbi:MAG TPA: GNAT family N-acetyltransferase [Bacillales bacterium]|nr:GNAT family N-acetyltransferase [Bacillales bacterium]
MIRKLTEKDHEKVMAFLSDEAAFNLFIIGDIENFGYDSDFQEIWAEFDGEGGIQAVCLRYYQNFLVYAKGDFDAAVFADIMLQGAGPDVVQGKVDVMTRFDQLPGISFGKQRSMFFAELKDTAQLDEPEIPARFKKAGVEDVDRLLGLRSQIAEFTITASSRDSLVRGIESGAGRTFFIEENGEIFASASTTAENTYSAMVVGVATRPDSRRKGYASLCMSALCREVLDEGKTLCLFYDNPEAGTIYKRLGFRDIGMWKMYLKES